MTDAGVTDEEVAAAAYDAAESVVFSRVERTEVTDLDISVSFDGTLAVEVYLEGPDDAERIAEDAALAARGAADDLLE